MSLKILLIFVTVYKESSITGAAQKLGISQPAVSSAIKELESHYHTQLFSRSGRSITRTPFADLLYEYASHITSLYQEMDHIFDHKQEALPLRIGSSISIGACFMPDCIQAFIKETKKTAPYVKINSSDIIEQMILDNQLDFALIEGNIHSEKVLSEPLIKDDLILICSPEHHLAKKKQVRLTDLREENFLLREPNSGTRELAQSVLAMHDFILHPIWESTSTRALSNAVALNLGISILPKRMIKEQLDDGSLIPLKIPGISFRREYSMIYHQNKYLNSQLTSAMDFFKEFIQANA